MGNSEFIKDMLVEALRVLEEVSNDENRFYKIEIADYTRKKKEIINREQNLESGIKFAIDQIDMVLDVIIEQQEIRCEIKLVNKNPTY